MASGAPPLDGGSQEGPLAPFLTLSVSAVPSGCGVGCSGGGASFCPVLRAPLRLLSPLHWPDRSLPPTARASVLAPDPFPQAFGSAAALRGLWHAPPGRGGVSGAARSLRFPCPGPSRVSASAQCSSLLHFLVPAPPSSGASSPPVPSSVVSPAFLGCQEWTAGASPVPSFHRVDEQSFRHGAGFRFPFP